ncbi:uncharacterized protein LOC109842066 [Asparagus officinalis]|uniref:uncharacterized protein LOC109842066 n=1 Tax=Asparagus officinalis TaxID=4686 RepID=UPI00098E4AB3|nr:uncharacterized protein LOC109842066 [Asparagus officinalis]
MDVETTSQGKGFDAGQVGNVANLQNTVGACCTSGKLQLSFVYNALSQSIYPVPWFDTVWRGLHYPKHSVILWLAAHSRLLTQDRLCRMGMLELNRCVLCQSQQLETCKHLFFECQFSADIWNKVMNWMSFSRRSCNWNHLINWYSFNLKGGGCKQQLKRMALLMTIYMIWQERNMRIFQRKFREPEMLFRGIKFLIFSKILNVKLPIHMKDTLVNM